MDRQLKYVLDESQIAAAVDDQGAGDRSTLEQLIAGKDTWTVDS